jgi:hypothetical protein
VAKIGVAPNRALPDRVQGGQSGVSDITLRSGRGLELELGAALTPIPTLTRTIFGASSLELQVFDPERDLLKRSLLAEKWDVEIDGLRFRYPGALSKSGDTLTITLEDLWVAKLREHKGPERAFRSKVTRAEFVKYLVERACPGLHFHCPQLHVVQPIKSARKAKQAKEDAKANRGRGLGDVDLTIDGEDVTKAQLELGDMAGRIAESHNAPLVVRVALFAALMAESDMGQTSPGNVLQALGAGGAPVGNAVDEINGFLTNEPEWTGEGAIEYHRKHPDAPAHVIAQAVQKSAFGDGSNYDNFTDEAREWAEAFDGEGAGGSIEITEPYKFEVGRKEDYWTAIKRLAKQVNWRAFIVGDRFFFMPEPELLQGMVRLAIDDSTPGVENVDFEYDGNSPVTEVTIEAFISQWKPPPASVVTLGDHGPASIGFGDAPVKPDKKGQRAGVSGNRNARTGEGRARYLVSTIEVPLDDDPAKRLATVTARKPTAPLPEPAPKTHSRSASVAGGIGGMGTLQGTPEDIVNQVIDYAHSNGFSSVTRASVRAANASHGPTISGGRSDHQGPPDQAWAADISNGGSPTPEMDALAEAIAEAFEIPWDGSGLVTVQRGDYELQLIYRTQEGGDHTNHVHFGVHLI